MPHISKLQTQYEDQVAFIGVTRENEAVVSKFLGQASSSGKTWDEIIDYRLAIDDRSWTNTAYMRAAGRGGIPCAFVVGRDGIVEWIGHPSRIDKPLEQIVAGTWDRDAAIAAYKQEQALKAALAQLNQHARAKEWNAGLELLDQLESKTGKSNNLTSYRLRMLVSAGRNEEASTVRAQLVEDAWDDASALNELAWKTATAREASDLDLALKAAERASELKHDEDHAVLDTLARCYYELGQIDQAIKYQQLAFDHSDKSRTIGATLKRYKSEKAKADDIKQPEKTEDQNSGE